MWLGNSPLIVYIGVLQHCRTQNFTYYACILPNFTEMLIFPIENSYCSITDFSIRVLHMQERIYNYPVH